MPNINARVQGSATAIFVQPDVTDAEKKCLIDFCKSFGGAFEIDENGILMSYYGGKNAVIPQSVTKIAL